MIARVFPRRTKATPIDTLAFTAGPPRLLDLSDITEIHVSVAFTYDIPVAERLAEEWRVLGVPVKMGGPAFNAPGGEFEPGMYLKKGYVITSRGCPNRCWFCNVPKREGGLRELKIKDGWNVLDDNLLACSDEHINEVFEMLTRQPQRPEFTGGLEAAKLKQWHAAKMALLKTNRMYFAYDTPDDYEPLVEAGKTLRSVYLNPNGHRMCCYVLIGYRGDTFERAEIRLHQTIRAGFMPYAMLYRDEKGQTDHAWERFQSEWIQPEKVGKEMQKVWKHGSD